MNFQINGDNISITNEFDHQTYTYDVKEMNDTNTWNPYIHKNDNRLSYHLTTCPYCHTQFNNKNNLLKHLGYFNIDISTFLLNNISL